MPINKYQDDKIICHFPLKNWYYFYFLSEPREGGSRLLQNIVSIYCFTRCCCIKHCCCNIWVLTAVL